MSELDTEMDSSMAAAVAPMLAEHTELEARLADPQVHTQPELARSLGRRYSQLQAVITAWRAWQGGREDLAAATELAAEDEAFAAELPALRQQVEQTGERLKELLVPRDPDDDRDVILEIKAGEGGQESALFAGDLMRMYFRFAERQGWRAEILDRTESELGGLKDISVAIKAPTSVELGEGVFAQLKFEGGVHRVQRVPVTESSGRIHTSAAGVLVLPEVAEVEVQINPDDLRIDVFRSSGPGGQSVNTTDSAIRITHLPTGLVVSCQNEKSQLQNKEQALRILRARLHAEAMATANAEASDLRRAQVRTVDRSERIRTYNFPENRIADHRSGYKAYNLDAVLDGELLPLIRSCQAMAESARLANAAG